MEKSILDYIEEILESPTSDHITGYQAQALDAVAELLSVCDYDHLRELVQAEQDGRLVVLPCYTGDKVYIPLLGKILELKVGSIVLNGGVTTIYYYSSSVRSSPEEFGKNVFLTREEAEAALEGGAE